MMENKNARDWARVLSEYRHPCKYRSSFEIAAPCCALLWRYGHLAMVGIGILVTLLAVLIASMKPLFFGALVCIHHTIAGMEHCLKTSPQMISDWSHPMGGVHTNPYEVWRRAHSIHHGASGNLTKRGIGDIDTLTVSEYQESIPRWPIEISPLSSPHHHVHHRPRLFVFPAKSPSHWIHEKHKLLDKRDGNEPWDFGKRCCGLLFWRPCARFVHLFVQNHILGRTTIRIVWLFYVQHQFEYTYWEENAEWDLHDAALHGSSHYVLPSFFQWMTANIGIHHIHHLSSRIPFYRLTKAIKDHPSLAEMNILTVKESLIQANLHLWDEENKCLVPFSKVASAT